MDASSSGLARLLLLAAVSGWLLAGVSGMAAEPQPLRIYLFASSTCPECVAIKGKLMPRLQEVYGNPELTSLNVTP
jgi:hypothetical protein